MVSCGENLKNFEKAITGGKTQSTDEFLIRKKDPLILPPEYKKLPLPEESKKDESSKSVQSILGQNSTTENSGPTSDLEKSVLEELRKN